MIQLLYVSHAVNEMSDQELHKLLNEARSVNKKHNITGILLYHKGYFMQLLEGDEADVEDIFSRIQKDRRHHKITTIGKYNIDSRSFNEWNMAYKKLTESEIQSTAGFSDIFYKKDGHAELLRKPTILVDMLATLFQINS